MKKKILFPALLLLSIAASAQDSTSVQSDTTQKKGPVLKFEVMEISDTAIISTSNTVALKEKNYKYAEYRFVNAGDEPLFIESISQPTPCFTAAWPRTPIKPGEGGVIKFTCPGKPEGDRLVMGFTVTSNDPEGIKVLVLKRQYVQK
jgi:hypothetical protein